MRTLSRHRQQETPKESFLQRWLDPIDRLAETIFSILILLTFTLAFRIIRLGDDPTQPIPSSYLNELLVGAAGATLAWGIIDGIMYALLSMFERGEQERLVRRLHAAVTEEEGIQVVADELDYLLAPLSGEQPRRYLYRNVMKNALTRRPQTVRLSQQDIAGGLSSVVVAMIAVLPSYVPLLLFHDNPAFAIRASNVISFAVLFVAGYQWGKYTGTNPWSTGSMLAGFAALMVLIAIPLGG